MSKTIIEDQLIENDIAFLEKRMKMANSINMFNLNELPSFPLCKNKNDIIEYALWVYGHISKKNKNVSLTFPVSESIEDNIKDMSSILDFKFFLEAEIFFQISTSPLVFSESIMPFSVNNKCQYKGYFFSYSCGYIMVHSNPTIEKKQYMHALCKYDDQGVFIGIEQISQDEDDFDDYNLMRNYDVITAELVFKIPRIVRGS